MRFRGYKCLYTFSGTAGGKWNFYVLLWVFNNNNQFNDPNKPRLHDTTCCQTGCQTGCQTSLTTGCIVYTNIQPVVKPVWIPS